MSIVLEALEKAQREKESVPPTDSAVGKLDTIILNRLPVTRLKTGAGRKRSWIKQKRFIVGAVLVVVIANIFYLNWWLQRNDSVFSINIKPNVPPVMINKASKTPAIQTIYPRETTTVNRQDPVPRIRVTGVVWDMQEPIALINGKFIKNGNMVSGARVKDIRLDKVVFSYKGKDFSVSVD